MLSMAAIPSAQNASEYYFKAENYYTAEKNVTQKAEWHGKGGARLGLEGQVTQPVFAAILKGQLPNDIKLGRTVGDEWKHFPGVDMTFSAPKSLSLLAYIGGDSRLLEANRDAVKSTLNWVEGNMIMTRIKAQGETRHVKTGSLVAALFPHDMSRTNDPQAHIHAIVMNATERLDGKWVSVHNPPLWRDSMLVGRIYRNFLGVNVRELGYQTQITHRDGRFEIKGVSDEAITEFSGRSKEIDDLFKSFTHQNTKTRDIAAVMSRSHKQRIGRDDIAEDWRLRAAHIGFNPLKIIEALDRLEEKISKTIDEGGSVTPFEDNSYPKPNLLTRIKAFFVRTPEQETARNDPYAIRGNQVSDARIRDRSAVSYALRVLSEREVAFRENDIRSEALNAGIKGLNITGIDNEIKELKADGLILDGKGQNADMVTTRQALALETATIRQMRTASKVGIGFLSRTAANAAVASYDLNDKQADAAVMILSSSSGVVAVQGYAGTGKTRMLKSVASILKSEGKRLIGLAPTHSAKEVLSREAGIEASTLQHFLMKYDGVIKGRATRKGLAKMRAEFKNIILVVDEASMKSMRQMHDLQVIMTRLEMPKLVLVGDTKQLSAIQAGKPYKLLLENGLESKTLDILMRQKDEKLKGAVRAMTQDNVAASFDKLRDGIIEAHSDGPDKGLSISEVVVDLWTTKSEALRENTLVVAASNRIRKEINQGIRSQLKSEGKISGPKILQPIFVNRHLTREENRYAATYSMGDKIRFHRAIPCLKIKSDSLWAVMGVDHDSGKLYLKDKDEHEQIFRPNLIPAEGGQNFLSVFEQSTLELSAGDKIRWTGSDMEQNIINGQRATIVSVIGDAVTMKMADGKERSFDPDDPILNHIDHGYALTAYASQGTTFDRVIAALDSSEKMLTNRQTFYVEISRAREHVDLVVDSKKTVLDELMARSGEKTSAIEILFPGNEEYSGPFLEREQKVGHELSEPGMEQADEQDIMSDFF